MEKFRCIWKILAGVGKLKWTWKVVNEVGKYQCAWKFHNFPHYLSYINWNFQLLLTFPFSLIAFQLQWFYPSSVKIFQLQLFWESQFYPLFFDWPFYPRQFYPQKLNFCEKSILSTFGNFAQNTVLSTLFANETFTRSFRKINHSSL